MSNMPYLYFRKDGKYCMKSKKTGKTYCYPTLAARRKGEKMHHAFAHGFKKSKNG